MFIYYNDLKMILSKKNFFGKNVAIYIVNTKKNRMDISFSFQNWLGLVIFTTKYEVISAKESTTTNEKREKDLWKPGK
jgi:hypothetical protein